MTRILAACLAVLVFASPARAQRSTTAAASASAPFEVLDNSFLLEEAFNQDPHIFQNIFSWSRGTDKTWDMSFTQEWPLGGMAHQFSYTLPFSGGDTATHLGGVLLNYRYQLMQERPGRPAIAPRISVILPTGKSVDASDHTGLQTNVSLSQQIRDVYFHGNAGFTWVHRVRATDASEAMNLLSPQVAASIIWRMTRMFHVMLESVVQFQQSADAAARLRRERIATIAPGFRYGWNIGEHQVVLGAAAPLTTDQGDATAAVLAYFSYELPFGK